MAKQRHTSVSFSIGILFLLTSSSSLITVAEEDGGGDGSDWEVDGRVIMAKNTPVTWKYEIMWTKSSIKTQGKSLTLLMVIHPRHYIFVERSPFI